MKKITIAIAIALISSLCNAQTDYVKVLTVTDTVSVNDSITIKFKREKNYSGTGMAVMQLWTSTYLQVCYNIFGDFLNDTNIVKVKILPIMGNGNARIYSNNTVGGYKPFYIRIPKPPVDTTIITGIKENELNLIVKNIKYYDVYGRENTSNNEGLIIKITTFENGYIRKEKVIIP
ncbi:MAG: hypothetical protein ACK504_11985 [Bacteroidota bacterium]